MPCYLQEKTAEVESVKKPPALLQSSASLLEVARVMEGRMRGAILISLNGAFPISYAPFCIIDLLGYRVL